MQERPAAAKQALCIYRLALLQHAVGGGCNSRASFLTRLFYARGRRNDLLNRLGYRLEGPNPKFTRASGGEGGSHPSNLLDYTYAVGTINFTGNMPIILSVDGPSLGGFVSFATIATAELWKIGQAKPGDVIWFKKMTIEQALDIQRWQNNMIDGILPNT